MAKINPEISKSIKYINESKIQLVHQRDQSPCLELHIDFLFLDEPRLLLIPKCDRIGPISLYKHKLAAFQIVAEHFEYYQNFALLKDLL